MFLETLFHVLRDCTKASRIWEAFNFIFVTVDPEDNAPIWMFNNVTGPCGILFFVIAWFIWQARNMEVF